jgi:hypothetical protein
LRRRRTLGRECFMDELAAAAGADQLEFPLAHLEPADSDVLEEVAPFRLVLPVEAIDPDVGVGPSRAARTRAHSWPPASRSRSTVNRGRSK